jgi:hypothetical protein
MKEYIIKKGATPARQINRVTHGAYVHKIYLLKKACSPSNHSGETISELYSTLICRHIGTIAKTTSRRRTNQKTCTRSFEGSIFSQRVMPLLESRTQTVATRVPT